MSEMILFIGENADSEEGRRLFPEARVNKDGGPPLLITEDGKFEGIDNIKTYHEAIIAERSGDA